MAYDSNSPLASLVREELQAKLPVTRIQVVTQAEYDALPLSKNYDNTLYLIKG